MSIAIQHRVLLSMLPPPVAVRFGLSQQLIWAFGFSFSAHRFLGREGEREAVARQLARGANETSRKMDIAVMTRGQGQRCQASPCTYDVDGVPKKGCGAGAQSGSISCEIEDPEARGEQEGESRTTLTPGSPSSRDVDVKAAWWW